MIKENRNAPVAPIRLGLVNYIVVISCVQYIRECIFLHETCFSFREQWLSCQYGLVVV